MSCPFCNGACTGADLAPLLNSNLHWLWKQLGQIADRRGDDDLMLGTVNLRMPESADERSGAVGLLGGRLLRSGQQRRVELAQLTARLRSRGSLLTPGAVAAHATGRRLAVKAHDHAARTLATASVRQHIEVLTPTLPGAVLSRLQSDNVWGRLQRSGWTTRIRNDPDPSGLLTAAFAVLAQLPEDGQRLDRRTLVPGDPHALDEGRTLAGLVLALANASTRPARKGWGSLGIDCDDLLGGLIAVGLRPADWSLPADAVFTVPPRELAKIQWQAPSRAGAWAFVTENPSILAAATELASAGAGPGVDGTVHLLCTAGTPSRVETNAVGSLLDAGWRVAVRADFDEAGLAHVRALLTAAPQAIPWRMDAADYLESNPGGESYLTVDPFQTPWDPALAVQMTRVGAPAYEEDLMGKLLTDLRNGLPRSRENL